MLFTNRVTSISLYFGSGNKILFFGTLIMVLIACSGIFSLSTLLLIKHKKSNGVKRVFGASLVQIALNHINQFTWLFLIANAISWLLVYYIMGEWLKNFAYSISLEWNHFFLGAFFGLVIILSTIGYHAIKSAIMDPSKVLKDE